MANLPSGSAYPHVLYAINIQLSRYRVHTHRSVNGKGHR
nr:MAG TPA: hypothetical protein [Caudoviricetes sp.]